MSDHPVNANNMAPPSVWARNVTQEDLEPGVLRAEGVSIEALNETLNWAPRIMSPTPCSWESFCRWVAEFSHRQQCYLNTLARQGMDNNNN